MSFLEKTDNILLMLESTKEMPASKEMKQSEKLILAHEKASIRQAQKYRKVLKKCIIGLNELLYKSLLADNVTKKRKSRHVFSD